MTSHEDTKKEEKKEMEAVGSDTSARCCYYAVDPCGCYVDPCTYYVDPCGCYIDPCCC